jgi:hypothetical protein
LHLFSPCRRWPRRTGLLATVTAGSGKVWVEPHKRLQLYFYDESR